MQNTDEQLMLAMAAISALEKRVMELEKRDPAGSKMIQTDLAAWQARLEQRTSDAMDAVGAEVAKVAAGLQDRFDEQIRRLTERISSGNDGTISPDAVEHLADRLDERVSESERRSADAIGQIGEQVARVVDRLQSQHEESMRIFEARLADSGRAYEGRLSDTLTEVQRTIDEGTEVATSAIAPVNRAMTSLALRITELEDLQAQAMTRREKQI